MIQIKIKESDYLIHTSFAKLPFGMFVNAIDKSNPIDRLSAVTGIPSEDISQLSFEFLSGLFEAMAYIDQIEILKEFEEIYPFDVGAESWEKFETAKLKIKEEKDYIKRAVSIANTYTGKDYISMNTFEAWSEVFSYGKGFDSFCERYKRLNDWQPSTQQEMAGIDRFDRFGFMPSVIEYAQKYGLTHDEALAKEAEIVYYEMLIDFEKADYQNALMQQQK